MKRLAVLCALFAFIAPSFASAAISYDTISGKLTGTSNNSFTPGTGSNAVFVIWVEGEVSNSDNVTSVTVDGSAATQEVKGLCGTGLDYDYGYLYLGGGDGSSHIFKVSTSSGSPLYHVVSYFGVNQSTTLDNTATSLNQSVTSSETANITVNTVNSWATIWASQSGSATGSLTAGGSTRVSLSGSDNLVGDLNSALSTGSHAFTYSVSGATTVCSFLLSLAPAVTVTPSTYDANSKWWLFF